MSPKVLATGRTVAGFGLWFTWHGGEYIEIRFAGEPAGFEVINVWDHGNGDRAIPFTRAAFLERVNEWINDAEADHEHDLREYAFGRQG